MSLNLSKEWVRCLQNIDIGSGGSGFNSPLGMVKTHAIGGGFMYVMFEDHPEFDQKVHVEGRITPARVYEALDFHKKSHRELPDWTKDFCVYMRLNDGREVYFQEGSKPCRIVGYQPEAFHPNFDLEFDNTEKFRKVAFGGLPWKK